jgi:hypothetical protein
VAGLAGIPSAQKHSERSQKLGIFYFTSHQTQKQTTEATITIGAKKIFCFLLYL